MVSEHFNRPGDTVPVGGVQRHIESVSRHLDSRNHQVFWIYPDQIEQVSALPDAICVFHDFSTWRPVPQSGGTPIPRAIVFHGWEGAYPVSPRITRIRQEIAQSADYSIAVGHYIVKHYQTTVHTVIYGGADRPKGFVSAPNPMEFNVAFLGRLAPDTEPLLVMGEFMCARWRIFQSANHLPVKFHFIGDGPLRGDLERVSAGEGCNLDFIFHGFKNEVWKHLSKMDAVVPTGYLSALEAMSAGTVVLPFVSNKTSPIKRDYWELASPFASRISVGSELCDTLTTLALSKISHQPVAWHHLAESDPAEVDKGYTWARVADVYEKMIEHFAAKTRNR